ncbi:MAG TPA: class I SAM-dependent methyltransferase [Cyclobacteriaceae bacterium]|nr:class I SAM-dependent methyltransferase [Cyclobacteriaceae bacterium]HRJ83159.1 class I SAM-dependent methyltransferase [Cyclobacteriaceae bacterium]
MSAFFKIKTYFNYWLDAVDEHSLHAPFLFDFYTKIIKREVIDVPLIESLRKQLSNDHRVVEVEDFGAGSKHLAGEKRKISDIAKLSLSDAKFSTLYSRIAGYCKAKTIIELGTSLGINTLYLAQQPQSKVYTFEGSASLAEIASISFEFGGAQNIELITGNLDTTLYSTLSRIPKIDMVFMDANHRYEPTLRYFDSLLARSHHKSIFIVDDIHDTPEMEKAWTELKKHPLVYTSADLFRCGLLFLDPSLNKQHVVLRF